MPWTTPVDRSTGYTVTAVDWNATGQDDLSWLYGDAAWTNVVVFTNSWTSASGPVGYILIGRIVFLRGALGGPGTAGTSAFTLPTGYRPSIPMQWVVPQASSSAALNIVTVNTTGTVVITTSAGARMDGVTFPTA